MKHSIALFMFLTAGGVANADSLPSETNVLNDQKPAISHAAATPAVEGSSASRAVPDVQPVTVTGNRPRSLDSALGVVGFRSTAARTLSTPLEFDVVTDAVLLTVGTGNTDELRRGRIKFPFANVQDSAVRNSDVLRFRLARFKLD